MSIFKDRTLMITGGTGSFDNVVFKKLLFMFEAAPNEDI